MRIDVITLFPALLEAAARESILGRAIGSGRLDFHVHQLRDYARDRHRTVDDRPYGGGPGMVLKCEPLVEAIEAVQALAEKAPIRLLSPGGRTFDQAMAWEFSRAPRLIFVCGHYEGVDQRVIDHWVDEEVSIGDFVVANGAVAVLPIIDAVARLLPGVLGNAESVLHESFEDALLEGPQYTRPAVFREWGVPEILLSGDHGAIGRWRRSMAEEKTRRVRTDLWERRGKGESDERNRAD
ncbi:tRNA (guanosine(37)-N1)-methyltransferase TrmD [Methylacidimicrobium sp. B4]|uniref:tRNA (guanosine(37)-N1)-methyltransferase TrmD n=1 Tax=Methylacidimicrobium sp. B4 TaxID=2796139 RepID=UPI001A8E9386|nr:tRNA (guanosine(37)-N1)-methyltransferase TrmD [Methylacidimicrobium sp. B4]QSR85500.1 tRNA (guanosine(37)-N1)-methyltransferase TrmD [Methylacidimicrobium sp. B4]